MHRTVIGGLAALALASTLHACALGGDRDARSDGTDAGAVAEARDAGAGPADDAGAPAPPPDAGDDRPRADAGDGAASDGGPPTSCGDRTRCGGECVDTAVDARHCGACDVGCDGGEVCDGAACRRGPVEAWSIDYGFAREGSPEAAQIHDFAVDDAGHLYVAGHGGAAPYRTAPGSLGGGFVESFDRRGGLRFRNVEPRFESHGAVPLGVTVGAGGRYYVVGGVTGPHTFDATHTAPADAASYVAAYEADHTLAWLLPSALDPSEQIEGRGARLYTVLRGQDHPVSLAGVTFSTDDGIGYDWYTVALATDGAVQWGRGSTESRANGLAATSWGVVRAGYESTPIGGGHSSHTYSLDAWDTSGARLDGYAALGDHGVPGGTAVAEGGGAVYVAVRTARAGWTLQRYEGRALVRERALGSDLEIADVVVDARGRPYLLGHLTEPLSFDGDRYGAADDGFVVALDASGDTRWAHFLTPPPDGLYLRMEEVEVGPRDLVFFRYRLAWYHGERIVALRQP
ncbi:MAG TPA: hypothetical protein RMH99_30820 [Sandaracinaceae bacterium LLY-WYZ-13_1]|nr:hypothetical protein [Sandaracinaceae bacterium LLY-WYZ-13_1]